VDHVTIWRWVQRYAPELERRLRRHLKPTNDSWRVDETRGREEHIRPAYHGLSASNPSIQMIHGTVKLYKGKPEINVLSMSQIEGANSPPVQ
jgi:hypothetical protein